MKNYNCFEFHVSITNPLVEIHTQSQVAKNAVYMEWPRLFMALKYI